MLQVSRKLCIGGVFAICATAVAACDGVYPSTPVAGYYQLATVNGRQLPYLSPPSFGFPWQIRRGDLLLRPNGTFMQVVGSNSALGPTGEGTYRRSGTEVTFHWRGASPDAEPLVATARGDSIAVTYGAGMHSESLHFVFRRVPLPASVIPDTRYRLSSVNGRTGDLVVHDTTVDSNRYVSVVVFDTLEFFDGVFVRRHRAEADTSYYDGLPALFETREWTAWGAIESGPGWVRGYYHNSAVADSLAIRGDTLVRRTPLITGVREDRYPR